MIVVSQQNLSLSPAPRRALRIAPLLASGTFYLAVRTLQYAKCWEGIGTQERVQGGHGRKALRIIRGQGAAPLSERSDFP